MEATQFLARGEAGTAARADGFQENETVSGPMARTVPTWFAGSVGGELRAGPGVGADVTLVRLAAAALGVGVRARRGGWLQAVGKVAARTIQPKFRSVRRFF